MQPIVWEDPPELGLFGTKSGLECTYTASQIRPETPCRTSVAGSVRSRTDDGSSHPGS